MYSIQNIVEYYDELFPVTTVQKKFYDDLVKKYANPVKILSIECGTGVFESILAREGYDVTGIESNAELLHSAGRRKRSQLMAIRFFQMDFLDMSRFLGKGFYNIISILDDRIMLIHDPMLLRKFFTDVHALLTDGGRFVISMPNFDLRRQGIPMHQLPTRASMRASLFTELWSQEGGDCFIKQNLVLGHSKTIRHKVSKNNFTFVYQRWCDEVKKSIQIDWDSVKEVGLLDTDFFLADLLSKDGSYLLDSLYVLLKHDHYQFDRSIDTHGLFSSKEAAFKDNMQAHIAFWNKYERPPKREYWGYIVERRDLLVPQDVRERKGSFFTPKQWVELSQQYLADTLGEDWQDNYYIWDCCAGTGNLLVGLTNPANIWASTLDKADVDVMHERIRNGARLFDNHIFQFDFLNDDFSKLPAELQAILNDPDQRHKLVIYINPPYAEAANAKTISGHGENKTDVAVTTNTYKKYLPIIGIQRNPGRGACRIFKVENSAST